MREFKPLTNDCCLPGNSHTFCRSSGANDALAMIIPMPRLTVMLLWYIHRVALAAPADLMMLSSLKHAKTLCEESHLLFPGC